MSDVEEYHVTVTGPVTEETICDVLEGADMYWAIDATWADGVARVLWWEDGERWQGWEVGITDRPLKPGDKFEIREGYTVELKGRTVTWKQLADALGKIARGDITKDAYQQKAALELIIHPADADWDAWTGEIMMQTAVFGHLEFG